MCRGKFIRRAFKILSRTDVVVNSDRPLAWKTRSAIVSRHRHRSQAEEHLKVLHRLNQPFTHTIVFDLPQF